MFGSRAIYHRGWKAVTYHPVGPLYDDGLDPNAPFDDDVWELYDLTTDLAETRDLAGERPELVAELVDLWWRQAAANDVLPLDNRVLWALLNPRPDRRPDRDGQRLFPGGAQVPEAMAVDVRGRSHRIAVTVDVADGPAPEGVLVALGSALGGWSVHLRSGRLHYAHNLYGKERTTVAADTGLGAGRHDLEVHVERHDPGAEVTLRCDGRVVGHGAVARYARAGFNGVGAGLTCGYEWGPAVGTGYEAPFPCTAVIVRAELVARGPAVRDPLAEIEAILSAQ
jgi:arylsulfatase